MEPSFVDRNRAIRDRRKSGEHYTDLAREYGVSPARIGQICQETDRHDRCESFLNGWPVPMSDNVAKVLLRLGIKNKEDLMSATVDDICNACRKHYPWIGEFMDFAYRMHRY